MYNAITLTRFFEKRCCLQQTYGVLHLICNFSAFDLEYCSVNEHTGPTYVHECGHYCHSKIFIVKWKAYIWYFSVSKIMCCSIWSAGRELKPLNTVSTCTVVTCFKMIPVLYHILKSNYLPFPYLQLLSYPGSLCVLHSDGIWYEWKFVFTGSASYLESILTYTQTWIDHINVRSLWYKGVVQLFFSG